jgi:hypothetical protein
MIGEQSTIMGDVELDPSQLLTDRHRRGETASSFNKSMDFARHTGKGKQSGSGVPASFHHPPSDAMLFGESYATMGESFLGESFANMGEASFAPTAGGFMDGGEYSYSDSNDGDEAWTMPKSGAKTDLATVLDIEEDEEEEESMSEGRPDDTSSGATGKN